MNEALEPGILRGVSVGTIDKLFKTGAGREKALASFLPRETKG